MDLALQNSLVITGIGMGLVFVAILLLWGLMEVMVRLFPAGVPAKEVPASGDISIVEKDEHGNKTLAAALAVAAALAMQAQNRQELKTKQTSDLSPWQLARRVDSLQNRQAVRVRKSKGVAGNEN